MHTWKCTIKGVSTAYSMGLGYSKLPYKTTNGMIDGGFRTTGIPKGYLKLVVVSIPFTHALMRAFNLKPVLWNEYRLEYVFAKIPRFRDVVYSLAIDASCARDSFEDFCGNMGYDTDSRKALDTYLACQESGKKLIMMGYDVERILAWEL